MEAEAAHGTVTRHYREHQKRQSDFNQSDRFHLCVDKRFGFRGKLDNNQPLIDFANALEAVCIRNSGGRKDDKGPCYHHQTKG